jgi:hypothetical protein
MRLAFLPTLAVICLAAGELPAQQVAARAHYTNVSNSFFEQTSVNWSANWGGFHFEFGSPASASPTVGGFTPGAGLSTGFGIANGNFNANFGLSMSQGGQQTLGSQTSMITLSNGQPGFMSDTSQTPFVIGQVPVVGGGAIPLVGNIPMVGGPAPMADIGDAGGGPAWANPQGLDPIRRPAAGRDQQPGGAAGAGQALAGNAAAAQAARQLFAAQESSAGRAAPSVAEARRLHEREKAAGATDFDALMERARTAEEEGKPGVAKIYYQMVVKHASGDLKSQASRRLEALGGSTAR